MKRLNTINAHARDALIKFDPVKHVYTHASGRVFSRSVTGYVKTCFPETSNFDGPKVVLKMLPIWHSDENSKYNRLIHECGSITAAKSAILALWDAKGEEARNLGTLMHRAIELEIEGLPQEEVGQIEQAEPVEQGEQARRIANALIESNLCQSREMAARIASRAVQWPHARWLGQEIVYPAPTRELEAFRAWRTSRPDLEPFRTEWSIFSDELDIAGQVDAVFRRVGGPPGELVIIDWKRISEFKHNERYSKLARAPFSNELDVKLGCYRAQLKIYKTIIEKHYGFTVAEMLIVQIHPDCGFVEQAV